MAEPEQSSNAVRPCPSWGAMTPADLLQKQAKQQPDIAFLTLETGETISFWQAEQIVTRLAAFLSTTNLKAGETVLLRQGRRHQGIFAILALIRLGLDICIVPQTMSARDACHGSRSLLPKGVIEIGEVDPEASPTSARIMDIAAGLFTVRFAGGFNKICDGMIDLDDDALIEHFGDTKPSVATKKRAEDQPSLIHALRAGPSGRVDRLTRTAGAVLTQALAVGLDLKLSTKSVVGVPFDPCGTTGFLCAIVPSLLVGARIELFNALDPLVADHLTYWSAQSEGHVSLLPSALFNHRKESSEPEMVGRQAWVCSGGQVLRAPDRNKRDHYLIDLGGFAFLPAVFNEDSHGGVARGQIKIAGSNGAPMAFGQVATSESNKARSNLGRSSGSAELTLSGPIAASAENNGKQVQLTGVLAAPGNSDKHGARILMLQDQDTGAGPLIGGQPVMMAAVNRSLALTGRWEDAAAFTVADPVLGHRIEVAVEPRVHDGVPATQDRLPTLEMVRKMLAESGLSDAALPSRLHLVVSVPRSASGQVLTEELRPFPIEPDAPRPDEVLEEFTKQFDALDDDIDRTAAA